jgi:hypothetical protein
MMAEPLSWRRILRRLSTLSWPRWRSGLLLVALVVATVSLALFLDASYPIERWLSWDLARIWAWQAVLCAACSSCGHLILVRALRVVLPPLEQLVMSMAVGVVAFTFGMYLGGALRIYGRVFAVALPAVMTAIGLPAALPALRRAAAYAREERRPAGILMAVVSGFGILAAGLLYMQTVTPDSISYDAAWTHLAVADDYARAGRIVPFIAEVPKALPHLASMLYTWGFLVPGFSDEALRWMMGLHIEFMLFLWTLAAVAAAVRWMLDDQKIAGAWAAFFLFPSFFVYDCNLGAGSDHIAAFFALPFLLAAARASRRFSPPLCLLAGLLGGAALHCKYQCIYLLGPIMALLAVRWIILYAGRRSARPYRRADDHPSAADWWRGPLLFAAGMLLALAPHILRNCIFYRNPVYPMLRGIFRGSVPSFPDSPFLNVNSGAPDQLIPRVLTSLRLMFTISSDRQTFFHGGLPVFGSLFSLLIPVVLLHARRHRRLLLGLLLAQGAVLMWAMIYRIDRNLQLILPWMVAVSAAAVTCAWRAGWAARLGLVPLVLLQVAWGGRIMVAGGADRLSSFVSLVRGDLDPGPKKERYANYRRGYRELEKALPKDAVVLLHMAHLQLGIGRRTLSDWAGWQYVIDYRTMRTARDVYLRYRQLGITHVIWNNYDFPSIRQEDPLFFALVRRYAIFQGTPGGFSLWQLPDQAPPVEPPMKVLAMGLSGYRDGLYLIDKLRIVEDLPPEKKSYPPPDTAITSPAVVTDCLLLSDAVLMARNAAIDAVAAQELARCFTDEHDYYSGYSIYLRKRNAPGCGGLSP